MYIYIYIYQMLYYKNKETMIMMMFLITRFLETNN